MLHLCQYIPLSPTHWTFNFCMATGRIFCFSLFYPLSQNTFQQFNGRQPKKSAKKGRCFLHPTYFGFFSYTKYCVRNLTKDSIRTGIYKQNQNCKEEKSKLDTEDVHLLNPLYQNYPVNGCGLCFCTDQTRQQHPLYHSWQLRMDCGFIVCANSCKRQFRCNRNENTVNMMLHRKGIVCVCVSVCACVCARACVVPCSECARVFICSLGCCLSSHNVQEN